MIRGDKVLFISATDSQATHCGCTDPRTVLRTGKKYGVIRSVAYADYTGIELHGVKGVFNSKCFRKVKG